MSRVRQTLQQQAGKQLSAGTGVHASGNSKPNKPKKSSKKSNPVHK